ncbi:centrosomal protein of 97 kDa isoform X2 [Tachysurus fulvidraco]|uniref:centrosomal protein of 97 kDa isoform X2 n=1 Tax=Tachysurus fulvidraco TaxID=1234273 RepID=UPI001FEFBF90|nr:centrosomal protein of 97 kDa isoform X2 [Tachysurus fulvidraco]
MAATEEASFYHPVTQMAKPEGPGLVDLSSQGIHKLDPNFCSLDTRTLILDQNHIIKLEHLEKNVAIQQLSVACNRLVRMMGVSKLTNLRVLNLPNNSIGYIEGMKDLVHLEWLNLAGNNIKVIEQLNSCIALQHLDLSDNNISHTGDISKLSALKDLAEVSYLAPLHNLQQLSIMNNPCVMATSSMPGCDHRPYVVSWCLNLKVLDGYVVSQKEGLKAEWLYSQGKGRTFRPGQHKQLVQYLVSTCPLTSSTSLQSAEDAKLERILSKQRQHQKQLLQEGQDNSSSPLPPTQLDMDQHWNDPAHKSLNVIGQPEASEPVVQMNTWMSNTSSEHVLGAVPAHSRDGDSLVLEDMQTDEEKLHGSLLSSESAFLPVNSVVRSPSPADSEEEELDEPDSLAPPNPARSHPRKVERVTSFHTVEKGEHLEADRMVHLQGSKATNAPEAGTELRGPSAMVAECHPHSAAVKIQAWWRGHWTRQQHPQAKEVRCEIRLRRLQDHIVYLTAELERVQQQQQEEKLQRMIQEEAVKFLWKQLQAMMEWQCSVKEQLSCLSPMQNITAGPIPASPKTTALPMPSEVSIPESGFQSPGDQQGVLEDSMSSAATGGSPETVRTLQPTSSPGSGADGDSQDSSLLEQYLSSVQRQEEEDEARENCSSLFSPAHGSEVSSCPDVVG